MNNCVCGVLKWRLKQSHFCRLNDLWSECVDPIEPALTTPKMYLLFTLVIL